MVTIYWRQAELEEQVEEEDRGNINDLMDTDTRSSDHRTFHHKHFHFQRGQNIYTGNWLRHTEVYISNLHETTESPQCSDLLSARSAAIQPPAVRRFRSLSSGTTAVCWLNTLGETDQLVILYFEVLCFPMGHLTTPLNAAGFETFLKIL